ncbi:MAG: sulfate transporter family protein [Rhodoblastus sp.]
MWMQIFRAAYDALNQMFSPPFRATLWKVLALTLALLALLWVGLDKVLVGYLLNPAWFPYPWITTAISVALGVGLVVGLAFIVAPVSMLVAGFFLDDLADLAEREVCPEGARGRALPAGQAVWLSSKFALVSLAVNLFALILFLLPGVNALVFFAANAYLFGREYFELAALRFHTLEEVRELRRRHAATLFLTGLFVAAFVAVPIVNLLTPLFGVAFMVRVHKILAPQAVTPLPNPAPPPHFSPRG